MISARTGQILADYTFIKAQPTFVNDVVLTERHAWFTDSQQAAALPGQLDRDGSRRGPGGSGHRAADR